MAQITRDEAKALGLHDEDDVVEVDDSVLQQAKDRAFYADMDRVEDGDKEGLRRVLAKHGRLEDKTPGAEPDPSKPAYDASEEAAARIRKAEESGDADAITEALWQAGRLEQKPQRLAQLEHDREWGRIE